MAVIFQDGGQTANFKPKKCNDLLRRSYCHLSNKPKKWESNQ